MNTVYALLFITACVAFLTFAAFALDAAFAGRTQTRGQSPRPTTEPRPAPRAANIHRPDLTQPGELARYLERVRVDAESQSY